MQENDRNSRDWCAIWGTILTSSCLMCMGFVLLVDEIDNTAGYSLVFSGGILLVLSIMAALGKCRLDRTYRQGVNHDPPPSYRWSWRRSFLRRHPSCSMAYFPRLGPSPSAPSSCISPSAASQ
ncbi:uncharacterized protein [Penaeus vannamei]|uniref:uncharacterized protein isoform X2 n=1 Tax=Penaeus vannamei TaxID=6689 RepID=UPI00387F95FF